MLTAIEIPRILRTLGTETSLLRSRPSNQGFPTKARRDIRGLTRPALCLSTMQMHAAGRVGSHLNPRRNTKHLRSHRSGEHAAKARVTDQARGKGHAVAPRIRGASRATERAIPDQSTARIPTDRPMMLQRVSCIAHDRGHRISASAKGRASRALQIRSHRRQLRIFFGTARPSVDSPRRD